MKNSSSFSWKYGIFFFLLGVLIGVLVTWQCQKRQYDKEQVEQEAPQQKPAQPEPPKKEQPEPEQEQPPQEPIPSEPAEQVGQDPQPAMDITPSICMDQPIEAPLHKVVANLEAKKLLYGVGPLTDCSGIFHRVLKGMKQRCPDQQYPTVAKYRSSRDLLRWYHERDELVLIKDALSQADLLVPGTVLFYGQSGSLYQDFTAEDLIKPGSGVDHVGVVVNVRKNKAGKVLSYQLFHGYGKKGKTAASTTDWHKRSPTRSIYPPFGNGRQQWVALAQLVSSRKSLYIDDEQEKSAQKVPEKRPPEEIRAEPEPEELLITQEKITLESSLCLEQPVEVPLYEIVKSLEAQKILYGVKPLSDCSGIFHRVLMGLQQRCPDQQYPAIEKYRSSRDLLRWYHEHDELILIKNTLTQAHLLAPGTVLFYGKNGARYQDFTVEDLIQPQSGVSHMGVVVSVDKNKAGEVLGYQLFHGYGRRGKTAASTTDWHKRAQTRFRYPSFGNGRQQWVALARLLSPKKSFD